MGRRRRISEESKPAQRSVLNAYYDENVAVFVERDETGRVVLRREPAELVCFLRKRDVPSELSRALRDDDIVRKIVDEGEWMRVVWNRPWEARKTVAALHERITTFEGDVSSIRRIVADQRLEIGVPRRTYLDIETDSRVPPRRAAEGEARILCWGVRDDDGNEFRGVIDHDNDDEERRILVDLANVLHSYDQVCAWYGDGFDFPAIKARMREHRVPLHSKRLLWLDHLEVYRRMNTMAAKSGEEKQSFALQEVAMAVLGEGKNDFDASKTYQAWAAGGEQRQILVDYMMQDVRLLPRINEKTGYLELLQTLCEVTGAFPDSHGLRPGSQVDNFLLRKCVERDTHFSSRFDKPKKGSKDHEQYEGAFVMDPTIHGIATDIHVADFSSMYPCIIRTWNMSPETKMTGPTGKRSIFFNPNAPVCTASTGTTFRTDVEGVLAAAVTEIMKQRSAWKKKLGTLPPRSPEWYEAYRRSTAYKIAANSFYGVIGSVMSRFFDRDVAEAVTQCGVWLIKQTMRAAEQRGMSVVYGDTDSLFVSGATREEFADFVEWCNRELYPRVLLEQGCTENFIDLGYEKAFKRLAMVTKKRYVGQYLHFDGKDATVDSPPEIKGLEFNRGDSTRLARSLQSEVAYKIVGHKCEPVDDPDVIAGIIEEARHNVLNGELEMADFKVSKRLSKGLDAYIKKRKNDGAWAKQPTHVEIAHILAKRGMDVTEGTRIEYFCVDGSVNPKKYAPIADFKGEFDRHDLWETFVWPATKRLVEAAYPGYNWKRFDVTRPKVARGRRRTPGQMQLQL